MSRKQLVQEITFFVCTVYKIKTIDKNDSKKFYRCYIIYSSRQLIKLYINSKTKTGYFSDSPRSVNQLFQNIIYTFRRNYLRNSKSMMYTTNLYERLERVAYMAHLKEMERIPAKNINFQNKTKHINIKGATHGHKLFSSKRSREA